MAEPFELVDDEELMLYLLVFEMLGRQYEAIKDNPQVVLSDAFWAREASLAISEIVPLLAQFAVNGANLSLAGTELAYVESVPNMIEDVRLAAQQQAGQLIRNISETTRNQVVELLDQSIIENWNLDQLTEALTGLPKSPFGEVRARMIAVSETTDAYIKGAELAGEELRNAGYLVTHIWQTVNDDRVCEICEPRNGKPQGSNWTLMEKAHIGCRCFTTTEIRKI